MEHTCCKYMYISFRNKFVSNYQSNFRENKCSTSVLFQRKTHLLYLFLLNRIKFLIIIFQLFKVYSYLLALYICALSPELSQLDMSLAEIWNEVSDWHNVYKTMHNTNMTEQRSGKSERGSMRPANRGILLSLHSSMFPSVLDKS